MISDILPLPRELIGAGHQPVEGLKGHRNQAGMGDPGAIVPIGGFALLVGQHLRHGGLVGGRIVLDGDLRGHAAHVA